MKPNYQKTMYACFIGYIVQAIVNNFVPLLFVTFQTSYGIPLAKITALITVNFVIQLLVDLLSAGFIDKIGYRASVILAHICAAAGLLSLTILPDLLPDAFLGILISVIIYAVGGGLLEVLVSPIIEACPTDNKEKAMSLLHSFYCWGQMGVVLLSTVFFVLFGIQNWKILALIWVIIPVANGILFARAPIYSLQAEGEKGLTLKELFLKKIFWVLMLMMMCAGASEQSVSQWASTFAEQGLHVSKTVGDLAGPMAFAMLMGLSRLIYGKYGDKMNLDHFMTFSCILCTASYLCISLVPVPIVGLLGCAVCGFSVGILWPGTFSKAAVSIKGGGTALFALLALAGDLGCSGGPTLAGLVSSSFGNNLRIGILASIVFPILLLIGILLSRPNVHELTSELC
ncbi:MAG: MFS transporter [Lachnospiraceae bacterium]